MSDLFGHDPFMQEISILRGQINQLKSSADTLRAQLSEAHETLRWVRQTVHQSFHETEEPARCRRPVCAEIAKALGEGG